MTINGIGAMFITLESTFSVFSVHVCEKEIMSNKPKEIKKRQKEELDRQKSAMLYEQAMLEGILEGSPDAIGIAVIRLNCGCRKMAAVDEKGEPASKVVIFRDSAANICDQCKKDDGAYERVSEAFIHWDKEPQDPEKKREIEIKVLGSAPAPKPLQH